MKVTRRHLLSSAAAAPLIVPPHTAFATPANSAVNFGIIGTGGRGTYVGGIFVDDPRARLAAMCDLFPDRIDQAKTRLSKAGNVPSYRDYHELLAKPDIDAVLIATPVFAHPEHFEAAAQAKKHIYCEKPAGADVAGVKRLWRAAELADPSKHIQFGFQQRYSPEYLAAEKILRSGQLGELTLMRSDWMLGGTSNKAVNSPYPVEQRRIRHWGPFRETSGDFIVEQDCHGLDVLNWFAGAHPLRAWGVGDQKKRAFGDNLDHLNVTYEYPNRLYGYLAATQLAVKRYWDVKEQFFGTEGVLETERKYYRWHRDANDVVKVDSKREITIDAVELFLTRVLEGKPFNQAFSACESTFTSLLGRMALYSRREVSWQEMMASA